MEEDRAELHIHTNRSIMQGISCVEDILVRAEELGINAIAITDNVGCYVVNEIEEIRKRRDINVKVIYGLECICDGYELTLLAKNLVGLKNIYKILSKSRVGLFKVDITKEELYMYKEGLLLGSSHLSGKVYKALFRNKSDEEVKKIINEYDYIELIGDHALARETINKMKDIHKKIIQLCKAVGKKVVVTGNVYCVNKEESEYKEIIDIATESLHQGETTVNKHLQSKEELLEEFSYLGKDLAYEIVVTNPKVIEESCEEVKVEEPDKYLPYIENSNGKINKIVYKKAKEIYGKNIPDEVMERLKFELEWILKKGYDGVFLGIYEVLKFAGEKRFYIELSWSGAIWSFVAFLMGIIEECPLYMKDSKEMFVETIDGKYVIRDRVVIETYGEKEEEICSELEKIYSSCNMYNSHYEYVRMPVAFGFLGKYKKQLNFYISRYCENQEYVKEKLRKLVLAEIPRKGNLLTFIPKDLDVVDLCPIKINQNTGDLCISEKIGIKFNVVNVWKHKVCENRT